MTQPDMTVGSLGVEISPQLDRAGLAAFRAQIRAATSSAARAASASIKQEFGALPKISDVSGVMAAQRVKAQQELRRTTRIYQAEANAWSRLQGQKTSTLNSAASRQKSIMAELSRDYDAKMRIQKEATIAGQRASADYSRAANSMFANAVKAGVGLDQLGEKTTAVTTKSRKNFLDFSYEAGSAMSQLATRVGMLGYQMQLLGRIMTTFVTIPVAGGLAAAAAVGLKQASAIEASARGMQALRPKENIIPFFERMMEFAEKSPVFEVSGLLDAIRKFSASNLPTNEIERIVRAMGNIGLTLGVAPQQMDRAFYAMTQIANKGKVYAEELNQQLGDAIPGIRALLAEGLSMSSADLEKLIGSKKFSADQFFSAITNVGFSDRFIQGAKTGATTLQATWASFIESTKNALARQFLDDRLQVKPEIIEGLDKLSESLKNLIQSVGEAGVFDSMISGFTKFVDILTKVTEAYAKLQPAQKTAVINTGLFAAALGPLLMTVAPLFTTIGMMANSVATLAIGFGSMANPAGLAAIAVLGLSAAFTGLFAILYTKSEEFRTRMNGVFKEWVALVDRWVIPAINQLWQQLVHLGRELKSLGIDWETVGTGIGVVGKALLAVWTVIFKTAAGGIAFLRTQIAHTVGALKFATGAVAATLRALADAVGVLEKVPGAVPPWLSGLETDLNAAAGGVEAFKGALDGYTTSTGNVEGTTFSLAEAVGGLGGAFSSQATNADKAAAAIENLRSKMKTAKDGVVDAKTADAQWVETRRGLQASLVRNGATLDEHTKKGRANILATREAIKASYDKMLMDIKSGVPMAQAIQRHKERTDSIKKEVGKTADLRNQVSGLVAKYGQVPKDVRTLMTILGYDKINDRMLNLYIQQRALKEGSTISAERARAKKLLGDSYATGGWTGPGAKYQPAGIVHADEYVVKKEARQRFERMHPKVLDHINRTGQLPAQYASGGRVTWPFPVSVAGTKIDPSWGNAGFTTAGGSGGVGSYRQMFAWLVSKMDGVRLTSGYRPGDPGYHGMGRAVDLTFSDGSERRGGGLALKAFNLIKSNFFKSIKELIWDFAGNNAVWNGRNHFFTGPSAGPGTHNDHIHWAHDNGGVFAPGPSWNLSGKPELVLNNAQAHAFEDRIRGNGEVIEANVYLDGEPVRAQARIEIRKSKEDKISALRRGRR